MKLAFQMTYKSIEEIRAAFYPRMARLLDLDPGELVAVDTALKNGDQDD